jgi:hypothetical protein
VKATVVANVSAFRPVRLPVAALPCAVNRLREVAGGVSDRPDPSIRRTAAGALGVTRRPFQGVARNRPKGDRGSVTS